MKTRALLPVLLVLAVITAAPLIPARALSRVLTESLPQPSANPLAPFERFMGGQWHLDGSYSEF